REGRRVDDQAPVEREEDVRVGNLHDALLSPTRAPHVEQRPAPLRAGPMTASTRIPAALAIRIASVPERCRPLALAALRRLPALIESTDASTGKPPYARAVLRMVMRRCRSSSAVRNRAAERRPLGGRVAWPSRAGCTRRSVTV